MRNVKTTKLSQPHLEEYHRQIRNLSYYAFRQNNQFAIMEIRDLLMKELVRLDLSDMRPEEQELITVKFLEFLREEKPFEICKRSIKSLSKSYAESRIKNQIIDMVPTRPIWRMNFRFISRAWGNSISGLVGTISMIWFLIPDSA